MGSARLGHGVERGSSRGERGAAEAQGAEARREEEERKGETDADRWAPSVSDGKRGCGVTRAGLGERERGGAGPRGLSGVGALGQARVKGRERRRTGLG